MLIKGTASLEVKSSEGNRELENFASLEPRVCKVLLYLYAKNEMHVLDMKFFRGLPEAKKL